MEYFQEVSDGGIGIKLIGVSKKQIDDARIQKSRIDFLKEEINKLQNELNNLTMSCPHTVRYDTPAIYYDFRHCLACGKTDLI